MTRVAVIPPAAALAGNALFEGRRLGAGAHSPNVHWMDGFRAVRRRGAALGIAFATHDLLPIDQADIVMHMSVPDPRQAAELRRAYPHVKAVLVLLETALGAAYTFNPKNHDAFDAVLTYDDRLVDGRKYFPIRPRAYDRSRIQTGLPFAERNLGCLVGTNRPFRRRTGLGLLSKGWRLSAHDWLDYVLCPGQLIKYRSAVGRAAARRYADTFHIYGEGWDDDPATREACRGIPTESPLTYAGRYRYYMAFENHSGEHSLISERIWDALWADSVPVYFGNTRIDRHVPPTCFVDARAFGSPDALLAGLAGTDEGTWEKQRQAGRAFIQGADVAHYLPDAFADEFLVPILALAGAGR